MQPPQHCRGVNVSDGMPCKRNQKLSPAGYCYQHLKQDPAYIEPEKLPNTPGPTQLLPTQQLQQQVQQEKGEDERRSASIGPSVEGGGGQNSNNEELERSHTDPSSVSASSSASTSGSSSVSKGDLPRCTAIAKTTGQQCCKRVSLNGETKCPKHGGKQIKLVSTLPMCGAISKSTRQPCQNHVTFAGQKFCSFHGGMTFRAAAGTPSFALHQQQPATFTPPLKPQQHQHNMLMREEYENPRGWAEIQAQSMKYLMETHPKSQCQCSTSAEPCQGMKIVMWAQALVQLAHQQHQHQLETQGGHSTASIFDAKVSDLVKFIPTTVAMAGNDNKNLFSDLYLAVSMFGSNIFFLPRFYQHIQHEASGQPPFVPHLLRRTTTDRESSSGLEMEEEANDNGGRNLDVF
jgi:hypothetical protein